MLYSEFLELTNFNFIAEGVYHSEIEKAYSNYAGTKEEFCKMLVFVEKSPVLCDGFLSSLIWGYNELDSVKNSFVVRGYSKYDGCDMYLERRKHFYTISAAILAKRLLIPKYPDFDFIVSPC